MDKIPDITTQYLKSFVETLRPEDIEIRKQLDYRFSWDSNVAILFEIRPKWNNPNEILQNEFVKIRYTKTTKEWKLYWMRASGKWELYGPFPTATNIQSLLSTVKKDEFGCFFG